jgi:hypothetical protein
MIRKFVYFCLFTTFLFCACKNPFGDDEITGARNRIAGKITVPGVAKPVGVYVWLEQIDIGVVTDDKGEFALQLPSKAASPDIEKLSGAFTLYFFTVNFGLPTAEVLLRDGEFEFGKADIDKNGRLKKNILFSKRFNVVTDVSPKEIDSGVDSTLSVTTTVSAVLDPATVNVPSGTLSLLGGIYIRNLGTGEVKKSVLASARHQPYVVTVDQQGTLWSFHPNLKALGLQVGKYEVIPYILPQEGAPYELYQSMSIDPNFPDDDFLKILFDQQAGVFAIL